ncbi:MAG: hypothetical protein ACRD5L_00120, partial [Bryobacteraceae bacterium]
WNEWLAKRYATHSALAEAWRSVTVPEGADVPLPTEPEFSNRASYEAWPSDNALRAMDYQFFAQDAFRGWASEMREAIRATGSQQLVTVGQDEGGGGDRPSPAFFGDALDFTTTHSWWGTDVLLWDSLMAKQPDRPMLAQETGVSREVEIDGEGHRSPQEATALLERKLAMAGGTSAGAIEWLWNINSYMRDDREATIGAIRPDGTEKSEAELMRRFAKFAAAAGPHLSGAERAQVGVVTAQALQYSPLENLALAAQQKSVRALNYALGIPAEAVPENLAPRMLQDGWRPKLLVLPAAQALGDEAWAALLKYVDAGGTLLITGSMERDPHWRVTERLAALGAPATPEPLLLRAATQRAGDKEIALSFGFDAQQGAEYLRFRDGAEMHAISHGKGRIFAASEPVELAEGLAPAVQLYAWALGQAGVQSPFAGRIPPGVLVRPVELAESVLYLIVSESANGEELQLRDRASGGEIRTRIEPGRAKLFLLAKNGGQVLAEF